MVATLLCSETLVCKLFHINDVENAESMHEIISAYEIIIHRLISILGKAL